MVVNKINIITYIKPTDDIDMFVDNLKCILKVKYIDKFCISFKEKLSDEYKVELNNGTTITRRRDFIQNLGFSSI